jgi:hypothetical protein
MILQDNCRQLVQQSGDADPMIGTKNTIAPYAPYFFLDFVVLAFFVAVTFCVTARGFVGAARKRLAGGGGTIFSASKGPWTTICWRFLRVEGIPANS